jgi:hypothetical protein
MIPREIFKKVRQIEIHTNRVTVCVLACLVIGVASAAFGTVLPPEVSINQDAGCGGWFKGGWLKVKLHLETGEEVVFMVDTGSPITILDDSFVPRLGKQVGTMPVNFVGQKQQAAEIYAAPKLLLGNVPLSTDSYVACTPLKNFNKYFQGILGMDCLQDYCIQFDFTAGKVRFLDSAETNAASWGKMYPLTLSRTGPHQQLIHPLIHQAGFFGNDTNLLIDTGCHVDGLVNKGESGEVIGAWLLSFLGCGRFHSGVWDGEKYSHIKVAPVDHVNVLGLRFLARHLVTLDFPNQKMYLKQTSVAPLKMRKPQPN